MHKLFKRGYWPRVLVGLILLAELILIIWLVYLLTAGFLDSTWAWLFSIVVSLVDLFFLIYIHNSSVPDAYKLSWMFIVGGLSVLGVVFYVLFANKKPKKQSRKITRNIIKALFVDPVKPEVLEHLKEYSPQGKTIAQYLKSASGLGIYENSEVTYFPLGDLAFPAMLEELRKAKHYIFMEYFILEQGLFFDSILEILRQKVKEGVDVRIIYDDFGCFSTLPVDYDLKLRKEGIQCYAFNKFRPILAVRMNNRDHRKILVIDGHTAFTGGINIADEYINHKERFGHWKDNAVMIKGQGAYGFTLTFLATFILVSQHSEPIDFDYYRPSTYIDEIGGFPPSDGFVVPFCDYPAFEPVGERFYISLLSKSTDYVYMATPYLIIDSEMKNAMCAAAREGKDVRLITPGIPDKKAVFQLTRYYYGDLLRAGVRIYEYTPGFIHEKTFLVDDMMGSVGTVNLDYRSLYLHLENGVFMVGNKCLSAIKRDFEDMFTVSREITAEDYKKIKRHKAFLWGFLRLVSPFL